MTKQTKALKLALEALEKANRRTVVMGSTGSYREGQIHALESVCADLAPAITAISEALAEQASKDKEQAKTDAYIKQLDEALSEQPAQQFTEDAPADCKRLAEHGAPICGRCHMGPCKYTTPQAQPAIKQDLTPEQPAQRTWVGLTDEEENKLWESTDSDWELMKRTEAKLREKNT